jgi:tetratricopeptide (TPR) repeat protein
MGYGRSLLEAGRGAAAVVPLERAALLDPAFAAAFESLGEAYLDAGRHAEAGVAYRRYAELVGPEASVLEQVARALGGSLARSVVVEALDAIDDPSWRLSSYTIARACMRLGERERALDWLERAARAGDPRLPFAFRSALFVPLRDDPRFRTLASGQG